MENTTIVTVIEPTRRRHEAGSDQQVVETRPIGLGGVIAAAVVVLSALLIAAAVLTVTVVGAVALGLVTALTLAYRKITGRLSRGRSGDSDVIEIIPPRR